MLRSEFVLSELETLSERLDFAEVISPEPSLARSQAVVSLHISHDTRMLSTRQYSRCQFICLIE